MIKQDQHSRKRTHLLLASKLLLILGLWFCGTFAYTSITHVQADGPVDVWWPTNNVKVSGLQPLKAVVHDKNVNDYDITWSVDGGQENPMSSVTTDAPHKEASVDVTSWNWHGSGPYHVVFKATEKNGTVIGESGVDIYGPDAAVGPKTVVSGEAVFVANPAPSATAVIIGAISQATGVHVANASAPAAPQAASSVLSISSPIANSNLTGVHTFSAAMSALDASSYSMYWQVDSGQHNDMQDSTSGGASHKEASVDITNWKWHGNGPYTLTFTAEKNGQVIGTSQVAFYTGADSQQLSAQSSSPAPTPALVPSTQSSVVAGNALSDITFFVNPNSNAKATADSWRQSRPNDAYQMDKIANSPEAIWLGGWSGDVESMVAAKKAAAKKQSEVPVFIAYNIPQRDCGSYSGGGMGDASSYASWIQKIASGISGAKAVVVLEPDALASTDCLSQQQKNDRYSMLSNAVSALKNAGALVYLDAGHPNWISANDMASRLNEAGIAKADGFALNVSNFYSTSENVSYGTELSQKVGGKHFVIDTSRNGLGSNGEWCNPAGRALGIRNTTNTGSSVVDAFLWLKNPGESDGNCNGGSSAGSWLPEYALELAKRSAI